MIPSIALMVGMYIITRMLQVLIPQKKEGNPSVLILLFAGVTILLTIYSIVNVFTAGAQLSSLNY